MESLFSPGLSALSRRNCPAMLSLSIGLLGRIPVLGAVLTAVLVWNVSPLAAQTYTHPTTGQQSTSIGSCMVTTCSGIYVDNGGAGGNYSADVNSVDRTFCTGNADEQIQATFSSFSMNDTYFLCFGPNSCCDYLTIYDGPTAASPVLFSNCTSSPGTVTSTNGCLTFRFVSDGSVQLAGWNATLSCVSGSGGPQGNTNSDCAYATPVCGTVSLNDPSSGPGIVAEGCAGCVVAEKFANWYKIGVTADGTLAFTINPNQNSDNFDFALYGPNTTCGALGTPVRCSAAAAAGDGNTGLGNGAVDNSEDVAGDQWVAPLNVTAGQTYLLLLNGNSATMGSNGFNLSFSGTADVSPASLSASISGSAIIAYGGSTTISFSGTPNATITYKVNNGANQTILLNSAGTATLNTGSLTATTTYSLVAVALVAGCSKSVSGSAVVNVCDGIIYVDADATGANNGSSWTDAFTDLQDALATACGTAEIWVAEGAYKPTSGTDRSISFVMKNGIGVYGGFDGSETMRDQRDWKTNQTILSGDINTPDASDNSHHVVFFDHATAGTILDGFTITGGNGETTQNGGGIYNDGSGVGRQSNPRIANCTVTGNVARSGGGLFNDGYRGNSSPEVANCIFSGNKATRDGGAVYNFGGNNGNSNPSFSNCIFLGNKAERIGGGVFNDAVDATGGVCSPVFINCSFSGNQADFGVGGMYNDAYTGTCSPTLTNCILWGNAGEIDNRNATPVVEYCIVQGNYAGTANLDADPLFVSQPPIALGTSGDLHLQVCSPAIDAGTDTGAPATDLDGNARVDVLPGAGIVDIGAFEFQSNLGVGAVIWTGASDTNWDNACNWDGNFVPGTGSDVRIPDVPNDPVVMAGTTAVANSVTIDADAALTVEATGSLTINGYISNPNDFVRSGMYNSGTVTNNGIITLGSTASVGNHAIYNNGIVFNNAGAEMHLDRADKNGIENNGAFTNSGDITIGAIDLGQFGILNKGTFENNAEAEIAIDRSDDTGLRNTSGTFTNAGKITLGANVSVGTNGLVNLVVFNNNAGGEINLDRSFKVGLYNNGAFTNEAKIRIGQIASPGDYGLWQQSNSATFYNNPGGEINIDRAGDTGLRNQFGTFNNAAEIVIGAVADVGFDGVYNSATLNNTPCSALIHIVSDDIISNSGMFTNDGLIIENATGNSSITTNNGVVQNLNGGTFSTGGTPATTFAGHLSACCPAANILYVNDDATGNNDGTSWTDAYTDLQSALASTCPGVTEIWVAEGTYKPTSGTDRTISFLMKNGVGIYGGFDGTETLRSERDFRANSTILSGNIGDLNNSTDNTRNVVVSNGNDQTAIIDGFIVRDGYANNISNNRGAGFRISNASSIIRNCVIRDNEVRFASSSDYGAAMYMSGASCLVESCVMFNNIAQTAGKDGGVYLIGNGSSIFKNCLLFGNSGGISANFGPAPELLNCTITGNNAAGITSFDATMTVTNCIIRGNGIQVVQGTAPAITYSITPGVYAGAGNKDADPLFVNPADPDGADDMFGTTDDGYALQACSPAIDAGDNTNAPADDLSGTARPFDAAPNVAADYDMGAYEYQQLLPAPTAICQDITVQLDVNGSVTVPAADVNDNSTGCGALAFLINGETSLAFTCDDLGNHTVTLTVTDAFDNNADCEATITVADDDNPCCAAPVAACQAYTAVLGPGGTASVTPANVDNGSTYECGLQSMTVLPNLFDCSDLGPQTVTLTVTDINGDSDECQATVTVADNSLPSITCPGPVTVTCSSQVPPVNLAAVTANDNCDAPTKSHVDDVTTNMTCANRKTITRTYRATDGSSNSATCAQIITVFDNVQPVFTFVPANVTVQCNSVPAVGSPMASDGCGGAVMITYNGQTSEAGTCTDRYTLTRQWTATDACGNTKTATQRINVIDSQQPNFTSTPANVTVQCDAIPAVAMPAATDNCDATVAITYIGQTTTAGACPNAYTLTRRWTAADNCGNTRSISQRITVVDNGKPVFTSFPANTTIACNETPPAVGSPTASDACGSATVTYLGQTSVSGSCPGNYQIRRTWRATDVCGNSTVATQTIQVSDGGAPVFTSVPGPLTIECGDPLPPLVNPTASDACGYAAVTFLGNVPSGSGCAADYTVTRTWRAEDLCGNSATTTQLITVLGNSYGGEGAENRVAEPTRRTTASRLPSITLQPNPTTDRVLIDLTDFAGEAVTVSIHSDLGQLVWERRIPAVEDLKLSVSLRESGAAVGIYTVSVRSARGVVSARIVLIK